MPKARNRYTFRAESPCIGHYRECIRHPASSRLCMVQFYLLLASLDSCLWGCLSDQELHLANYEF